MYVTQNPKIANNAALESKHRCSVPPNVATRRRNTKEFLPVVPMKAELPEDLVSLFNESQDVAGVTPERRCDRLDVANELLVSQEGWPK